MKKLPEFLSKLRESEKVETMGRTARRRQGVFFGRLGVPERSGAGAAGSGRCAVGVCFSERARQGGGQGPQGGTMRRRVPTGEPPRGVFFSGGRRGARQGGVRAAEGSGGAVNAVGTAVRALVEAPVGFEKALEGIGCGAGEVGRGGGVGGEHVGGGARGVGRRESGGGEHRAERGNRGEKKRRSGAAASARGAAGGGRRALWPRGRGGCGLRGAAARAPRAGCGG